MNQVEQLSKLVSELEYWVKNQIILDKLYTYKQAAELSGLSVSTIRNMVKNQRITALNIPGHASMRIRGRDYIKFIDQCIKTKI